MPPDLALHPCLLIQYMVVSTCYRILSQVTWRTTPAFLRSPEVTWNQRHTFQMVSIINNPSRRQTITNCLGYIAQLMICLTSFACGRSFYTFFVYILHNISMFNLYARFSQNMIFKTLRRIKFGRVATTQQFFKSVIIFRIMPLSMS